MKLGTVSAIVCTALLASFCNAIPSPEFWSLAEDELGPELLDQLDTVLRHRIGSDIEALIKQAAW